MAKSKRLVNAKGRGKFNQVSYMWKANYPSYVGAVVHLSKDVRLKLRSGGRWEKQVRKPALVIRNYKIVDGFVWIEAGGI